MKKCGRYGFRNKIEGVEGPYIFQNLCEDCQEYFKKTMALFDSGKPEDLETIRKNLIPSQEEIDFEESRIK